LFIRWENSVSWFAVALIVLVVVVGLAARWLFRQRDPSEIAAARERIKALWSKHR